MGELATNYADLFSRILNSNGTMYAVYDYCKDFGDFWSDAIPLPKVVSQAIASEKKALIIVWDDQPLDNGPAKLGPHLTPLDWALAFSTRALKQGLDVEPFSIHIIDLTSTRFENSFAMQMAASICDAMPWVKLYAPLPRGRRAYEIPFPIEELQNGKWHEVKPSTWLGGKSKDRLDKLNQAWRAWVAQSSDHHDLNNMVGPQIITDILVPPSGDSQQDDNLVKIMLTRLEWAGLLNGKGKIEEKEKKPLKFNQPINVVAIDDQLGQGWDRVLSSLLGISQPEPIQQGNTELQYIGDNDQIDNGRIKLWGATDPEYLLQQLYITNKGDKNKPAIKPEDYITRKHVSPKIPSTDGSNINLTVLILDLYLFADESVVKIEEWYKTMGMIAKSVARLEEQQMAWPGFTQSELKHLRGLAKTGHVDDENRDTAISLLPRLCALRWPSVPIFVFSSTGRRGVISKLAKYGNIFLSSPKPNVLAGNTKEQVAAFVENWERELEAMQGLLNVQNQLITLQELSRKPQRQAADEATGQGDRRHAHVVIAFDETGNFKDDTKSAVGGVMLFSWGKNEAEAIKRSVDVQENFRKAGINFFSRTPYYPDANKPGACLGPSTILTKKISNKTYVAGQLQKVFKDHGTNAKLSAFCCWVDKCRYSGPNEYQDGSYLRGLTTCIELIACELLPAIESKWEEMTISWWLPTKMTSHADSTQADKAASRFDFRRQGKKFTETIGGKGHAYSVVVQSLNQRRNFATVMGKTKSLRSRKIPYNKDGKRESVNNHWYCGECSLPFRPFPPVKLTDPSPCCLQCTKKGNKNVFADYSVLGHLADAVLSLKKFPANDAFKETLEVSFCFEVEDNEKLSDFIHVSRLIDDKRLDDAFKLAYQYSFFDRGKGILKCESFTKAPLEWRVQNELREYALSLCGNMFIELAALS